MPVIAFCLQFDVYKITFGPEGNYLHDFGPYFTVATRLPWGGGARKPSTGHTPSEEVRRFFIENALDWITTRHIERLRLDAVHAYRRLLRRPTPSWRNWQTSCTGSERLQRQVYLIAESELNDTRLPHPGPALGGYGLEAQERRFPPCPAYAAHGRAARIQSEISRPLAHLENALAEGYVYAGHYSSFASAATAIRRATIPAIRFRSVHRATITEATGYVGRAYSQLVTFERSRWRRAW